MATAMRVRSLLPLVVVGGTLALWACTASQPSTGENDEHLEGAVDVPLGTCTVDALPSDRSRLVAPVSPGQTPHHFEASVPDRIFQTLTLTAHVTSKDGARTVASISGKFTAFDKDGKPAEKGILEAPLLGAEARHETLREADGRRYAYHAYAVGEPQGSIDAKADETPVQEAFNALTLHWESNGEQWVLLGRTGAALHPTAAGASCTFDAKGWAVLENAACVDGPDAGECTAPTFGRSDGGADDAGAKTDAAAADASSDDASTTGTPAPKDDDYSYKKPNPPASPRGTPDDDYPTGRQTSDPGSKSSAARDGGATAKSTMKNPAAPSTASDSGGCSTTPGGAGSGSSVALVGLALALVSRRRRRVDAR